MNGAGVVLDWGAPVVQLDPADLTPERTMHRPSAEDEKLMGEIGVWAIDRLSYRDDTFPPQAGTVPHPSIGPDGIGSAAAWAFLREQILPTALPADHPRYLSFVPGAPSVAAVLADMAVSAAGIYAGSELEGGTVVRAERAALRWLADVAGMPERAHGTFVSGGSIANLSALVAARHHRRKTSGRRPYLVLAGSGAHASIDSAAEIMGCDVLSGGDDHGRLDAATLTRLLADVDPADVVAVAATAGATNNGAIDDLAALVDICRRHDLWLHVDAAYGGGGLLSDRTRHHFDGLGDVDSITIDPHKWFFTPFDCAAVLYRDPDRARRAHTQVASYLDPVLAGDNPADYAIHLTRRARGIPLWMSLVANGTEAYVEAVDRCLDLAQYSAQQIDAAPHLRLACEPSLSVVVFERPGWQFAQYQRWSERAIASGLGLVTPTRHRGVPALRFCFVNPLTSKADIDAILDDLR